MSLDTSGVGTGSEAKTPISDDEKLIQIRDPVIRGKVRQLKAAFENDDIDFLRDVLRVCNGCVDTAGGFLFGSLPDEFEATVKKLMKDFPKASGLHAHAVAIEARGNFDDASQRLEEQLRTGKVSEYVKYVRHSASLISSPPRSHHTSSTSTRHTHGVVESFIYRHDTTHTKTNGESSKSGNWVKSPKQSDSELQNQKAHIPEKQTQQVQEEMKPKEEEEDDDETSLFLTSPKAKIKKVVKEEEPASETFNTMAERLFDMFGGRVELSECENTLQSYDNDIEEAFKELDGEYNLLDGDDDEENDVVEISAPPRQKARRADSGVAGIGGTYRGRGEKRGEASSSRGQKRSATSPEPPSTRKKSRMHSRAAESSGSRHDNSSGLEDANDWLQRYYPDSKPAQLLLGPNEVARDTIPRKTLCDNSDCIKNLYDQQEKDESLDEVIRLPDVDPDIFDLAIQCLVAKDFRLPEDFNRSQSQDITIILDLVFLGLKLGLPDPGEVIIKNLKEILVQNRTALKPVHVRRAYQLPEDNRIGYLFSQAVVRDYMMEKKNGNQGFERNNNDSDSDDEEGMNAARRSMYQAGFRFKKELDTIRDFKMDLFSAQDAVLAAGEERTRGGGGTRRKPAITYTIYKDPLDDDKALEWEP